MYVSVLFGIRLWTTCMLGTSRGLKRALSALALELQDGECCHVGWQSSPGPPKSAGAQHTGDLGRKSVKTAQV